MVPFCDGLGTLKNFRKNIYNVSPEIHHSSASAVPFRAILFVSLVPFCLQFLSFESLLVMGSFMIAVCMFIQMLLFVYARHAKYGQQKLQGTKEGDFHLKGGIVMSIVVIVTPVLCCVMLWIAQGWIPLVIYLVA